MCESGGNYRALNPSSGAGGAYQILPSTWRAYGGSGLPHQASKAEQDRIAAMIWADSGPERLGLRLAVYRGAVRGYTLSMAQTAQMNGAGILAEEQSEKREEIIAMLQKAYWMEIETVMSYIANSVNPDGVRAQEIKESLEEDIQEELGHAQALRRADQGAAPGVVPGSEEFSAEQSFLQPPAEQTDIVHVIRGVIEAEAGAIEHYTKIVEATDQVDPVTIDMVIDILHDEQGHKRLFEGFLARATRRRARLAAATAASEAS